MRRLSEWAYRPLLFLIASLGIGVLKFARGEWEGCRNTREAPSQCPPDKADRYPLPWDWDPNCTRFHSEYPFACHDHACSPENEAYFLGNLLAQHARNPDNVSFFFGDDFDDESDLPPIWNRFVRMEGLADNTLELIKPMKVDTPGFFNSPLVPRICDPRFHLYCDSTFLRHEANLSPNTPKLKNIQSYCDCHPLYSDKQVSNRGLNLIECLGRPGVPCAFKHTSVHLVNFTEDSRGPKFMDTEDSLCMEGTSCILLERVYSPDLVKEYRKGRIFHGFGLSPILTRYLLLQVTKVCRCDTGHNPDDVRPMHDCPK